MWVAISRTADNALFVATVPGLGDPNALGSSVDPGLLTLNEREEAMQALASALDESGVPTTAVASVIAPRNLVELFAEEWAVLRGVSRQDVPLVHAHLTSVTKSTLSSPTQSPLAGLEVRHPRDEDIGIMTRMCFDFANLVMQPKLWKAHAWKRHGSRAVDTRGCVSY